MPSIAKGVGNVPAVEVLLANPSVRQLLQESRETELGNVIRNHEREGMSSFTQSLLQLVQREQVDPKVAGSMHEPRGTQDAPQRHLRRPHRHPRTVTTRQRGAGPGTTAVQKYRKVSTPWSSAANLRT